MTRLEKELAKRGIIFEADEIEIALKGIEHDCSAHLVAVTDKFIITVVYSAVIEPVFYIYDRFTFEPIGEQEVYKDTQFFNVFNPWNSFIY
jgi:hypothetical protein